MWEGLYQKLAVCTRNWKDGIWCQQPQLQMNQCLRWNQSRRKNVNLLQFHLQDESLVRHLLLVSSKTSPYSILISHRSLMTNGSQLDTIITSANFSIVCSEIFIFVPTSRHRRCRQTPKNSFLEWCTSEEV
jgi:hypothetical protein